MHNPSLRPRALPNPHFALRAVLALLAAGLLAACASPPGGLWPPRPGQRTERVVVYAEGFHSMIALPARAQKGEEDWSYIERVWFEDMHRSPAQEKALEAWYGLVDGAHALFWPNSGIIEISHATRPYPERNPEMPMKSWQFTVTPEGLARMRAWLDRSCAAPKPSFDSGSEVYFSAVQRYHLFHTCHHFTARALWEAGVPVHLSYCVIPAGFWWQLNTLAQGPARMHNQPAPAGNLPEQRLAQGGPGRAKK